MKVIIVGNINHQFVIHFVKYLRNYFRNQICIDGLSIYPITSPLVYECFNKVFAPDNNFINTIPKLKHPYRRYKLKKIANSIDENYDICHIHSYEPNTDCIIDLVRRQCLNLVITYWGSDLNGASNLDIRRQISLNNLAKCITFTDRSLLERHLKVFRDLQVKREIVGLGSEPFEEIVRVKKTVEPFRAKELLGLPLNKLIIQVGYSGADFHQHIKVIDEMSRLDSNEKDKIFLILPMTYGLNASYERKVKEKLNNSGIEFKILKEFLDSKHLAYLRRSVDLFIIMSTSDQFCGTLLEHLYLGNKIIAASWLPYSDVEDKWNGKLNWVNEFEELSGLIKSFILDSNHFMGCGDLEVPVKERLYWPDNIIKWGHLYKSLINDPRKS